MANRNEIRISVRNLVEFVLRSGDLDSRFTGMSRALEGTKAHQKVQKKYKEGYTAEVTLKHSIEYQGFIFHVEGRADGILKEENEVVIDEIKSTTRPLHSIDEDFNPLHWAQAKCYAYIYADQNQLEQIDIQITYYQIETEETKKILKKFHIEELEYFIYGLIEQYLVWADLTRSWGLKRDTSLEMLQFPFEKYRKGQRELAIFAYRAVKENKKLFAQAPTGIGKTMSTLFPAIKAMGQGLTSKIFYLTAKTITRSVAEEAISRMRAQGLQLKAVTLTAKEKICFLEEPACNPEQCEFAKGHFDRINEALLDILAQETELTRDKIEQYAKKHQICPFEFSLDLAIWADVVICDYNYVFDPRVYLKRFFMENDGDYTFLIDEAHNLVDRAREMFSAELYKKPFLEIKKSMKEKEPRISKALHQLNAHMVRLKKLCEEKNYYIDQGEQTEQAEFCNLLRKFVSESEEWLTTNEKTDEHEMLLELYFNALAFIKISELYDERYRTYIEVTKEDIKIKLFCLDPSFLLSEAVKRGKAAVFFSATLTPQDYFRGILGGTAEDNVLRLPSPFDTKRRCLLVADYISTKFKQRERSYKMIVNCIKNVVNEKKGNYIVFFPSYQYMNEVYQRFIEEVPEVDVTLQANIMSEEEREVFLDSFQPDREKTYIAFAVLGGIFSEGVDLKGDRLIGAIVVGVGLPQICLERDIIKNYFDDKNNLGYEYAYIYPGMNKVLQAAGRVIRSEGDKGVILLIDERFVHGTYQKLFPQEWFPYIRTTRQQEINHSLHEFWEKIE